MTVLEAPIKDVQTLKNYINGEWVDSEAQTIKDVIDPATCRTIARVPMSTKEEIHAAVKAAKDAFPRWRATNPFARARYLFELKGLLEERFENLSRIQTMEHGKTIDESRGETRRGIENVEVATGIPSLMMGYNLEEVAKGIDQYVVNQPVGVFCCVPPFNFPFMVPLWFLPYAVATGNTFVVKPSPSVPISQTKLFELIDEVGLPPGVVNMVHGGAEAASALLEDPDIAGVTFVGSTKVGRDIYRKCGETGKRVIAQCGAKNFLVVLPDADIENTVAALMTSFFGNTGQRCLAGANAVVVGRDDSFYACFVKAFVDAAAKVRVGNGLDDSVQVGPLQSADKKNKVASYIERGIKEGAKLLLDGREIRIIGDYPPTCFLLPTVFENVTPEMTIAKEEIFGPVACIMRAKDMDEAIDMIDRCPYGNASSIFTCSGKAAREFRHRVRTGNVGINIGIPAPMATFPFGGMKDSFFGTLHGQGREAIRFFTEIKVITERWF